MSKIQTRLLKICTIFIFLIMPNPSLGQISEKRLFPENKQSALLDFVAQVPSSTSTISTQAASTLGSTASTSEPATNPVTLVISLLSLGISGVVAYFSNFRKAEIKLSFGRNIIFFSVPATIRAGSSNNFAGVGFNIPITFYNWSPQGGTVHRIRLAVSRHGNDDYHDMAWTTFVRIGSGGSFEDEDLAQPIPVEGRSSVNKIIRFDWSPEEGGKQFDVQASNYELRIYGWTGNTEKPNLEYKTSFTLKQETHYRLYEKSINTTSSLPIWIPLDENEKPNQVLSANSIDRLYSNKK